MFIVRISTVLLGIMVFTVSYGSGEKKVLAPAKEIKVSTVPSPALVLGNRSGGRVTATVTIPLTPEQIQSLDKTSPKVIVKNALVSQSLVMRATDYDLSLRCVAELVTAYNKNNLPYDSVRLTFGIKNVWRSAVALIHLLKKEKKVDEKMFFESYIKPLANKKHDEVSDIANKISQRIVTEESIGASFHIFYSVLKECLNADMESFEQFIHELYNNCAAVTQSSEEMLHACNIHYVLAHDRLDGVATLKLLYNRYGLEAFNKPDFYGLYPMHYAAFYNAKNSIAYLLSIGCSVNVVDKPNARSATNLNCSVGLLPVTLASDKTVVDMLKKRSDINTRFERGKTPLMLAMEANATYVDRLIKLSTDLNAHDDNGEMALHRVRTGDIKNLILLSRTDVNAIDPRDGLTAKCKQVEVGNVKALKLTLDIEAEVNPNGVVDNKKALELAKIKLKAAQKKKNNERIQLFTDIIKLLEDRQNSAVKTNQSGAQEQKEKAETTATKAHEQTKSENNVTATNVHESDLDAEAQRLAELAVKQARKELKEAQKKQKKDEKRKQRELQDQCMEKQADELAQHFAHKRKLHALAMLKNNAVVEKKIKMLSGIASQVHDKHNALMQRNVLSAWRQSTHDQQSKIKGTEKITALLAKKQQQLTHNSFNTWRALNHAEKKAESEKLAQQREQQRLYDAAARQKFEQELAADQYIQQQHGFAPTIDAHEWFINHLNSINYTINSVAASSQYTGLQPDWQSLLEGVCATCAHHGFVDFRHDDASLLESNNQ